MMATVNPFHDFVTLRDAMNQLFQESIVDPARMLAGSAPDSARAIPLEIYQTPDEIVVKALLPGVSPDDLNVTYEQGVLTLQAVSEPPKAHDNWTWYAREFGYGRFARTVNLPVPVDVDRSTATFENGILTLTLPKAAIAKPKQIRIGTPSQVGGGEPAGAWEGAAKTWEGGAKTGVGPAGSGS